MNRRTLLSALLALPLAWLPKRAEAKPKAQTVADKKPCEQCLALKQRHPGLKKYSLMCRPCWVAFYGREPQA